MRCVDVNILVDAHRIDSPLHAPVGRWLDGARRSPEPLGLSALVAGGFLRVVTHPRIFREPTPHEEALRFVAELRSGPNVVWLVPGERHWALFVRLCSELRLRGNEIPDAYLAAQALEVGATWVTSDRGFGRYPGLRIASPTG